MRLAESSSSKIKKDWLSKSGFNGTDLKASNIQREKPEEKLVDLRSAKQFANERMHGSPLEQALSRQPDEIPVRQKQFQKQFSSCNIPLSVESSEPVFILFCAVCTEKSRSLVR